MTPPPPPLLQQHQNPLPTRKYATVLTPCPSIITLGSTPELTSTSDQQENIKELLSEFEQTGKS